MSADFDDEVIDLSGSTPPPPPRRHKRGPDISQRRPPHDSEIIVISDTEDERDYKAPPPPVRRVLSDAQINVPAPGPIPGPSAAADPFDAFMARVLEIIPDVSNVHLRGLLEQQYPLHGEAVVEATLHILFEDPTYPRTEKAAGKRKRTDKDDEGPPKVKVKIDYASKAREFTGGPHYVGLAMAQLLSDFPYIPKPHIRHILFSNESFYAPTYLFLAQEASSGNLPYKRKTYPSHLPGKGKQLHDDEFDKERAWLVDYLANPKQDNSTAALEEVEEEDEECEDGIECGCCFSKYEFDKMIQCPEAHLFCRSCCRSYAANLLGQHDPRLNCMDQSGCKELFPESELVRFLPEKLFTLYHRVKQQKEIAAAGLEGLEECPFCEYKVVIDNPDEKLFRCENEECGIVSCRACKKADHVPKSCKEAEEDKHLSVRHVIEEAMTKALMRNCPKCQKAFVKEHGCNKMTCPNCHTLSCYICRKVIVGYDHFNNPPPYTGASDPKKCNLWDPVEQRHNNEVIAAAKKAVEEYKALHPDVSEEALNVDLPEAVQNPPPPGPGAHVNHMMHFPNLPPVGLPHAGVARMQQEAQQRMQQQMQEAQQQMQQQMQQARQQMMEAQRMQGHRAQQRLQRGVAGMHQAVPQQMFAPPPIIPRDPMPPPPPVIARRRLR